MTRIPRQIRRHLREEGGAGSVSAEFGLMSTAVAAGTVVMIAGFVGITERFFAESCETIEGVVADQVDVDGTTRCPPQTDPGTATP